MIVQETICFEKNAEKQCIIVNCETLGDRRANWILVRMIQYKQTAICHTSYYDTGPFQAPCQSRHLTVFYLFSYYRYIL